MGKDTIERPRHAREIQRVDEQSRVSDLPAAAGAHETPKLLLDAPSLLGGLLLERAERSELTLGVDDPFHSGGAQAADQFVLQVGDTDVEPECFHAGATEVRAEAGPLETAPEVALLLDVTQAGQSDVQPSRTEQLQEASDVPGTAHRHDGNALSVKVSTTALSDRFERDLVADPFNEHDRACVDAGQRLDGCQLESLLVVHLPSLVLQPSIVIFMIGWPLVGRGRWPLER
jgi:hypothetical protein